MQLFHQLEDNANPGQIKNHTDITAQRQDTPVQDSVNITSAEIQIMNQEARGVTLQTQKAVLNTVISGIKAVLVEMD